jgi:hypothetical protein
MARYEGAIWLGFVSEVDDALEIAEQSAFGNCEGRLGVDSRSR